MLCLLTVQQNHDFLISRVMQFQNNLLVLVENKYYSAM